MLIWLLPRADLALPSPVRFQSPSPPWFLSTLSAALTQPAPNRHSVTTIAPPSPRKRRRQCPCSPRRQGRTHLGSGCGRAGASRRGRAVADSRGEPEKGSTEEAKARTRGRRRRGAAALRSGGGGLLASLLRGPEAPRDRAVGDPRGSVGPTSRPTVRPRLASGDCRLSIRHARCLCAIAPDVAPFMSDEAMVAAVVNAKEYTLKQFLAFAEKLHAKAKEFIANEGNGELPLEGTMPDMTSLTEYYVSLQKIYQSKAEFDCLAIEHRVKYILKRIGRDPDSISRAYIKTFCKNARKLRVCRYRSI